LHWRMVVVPVFAIPVTFVRRRFLPVGLRDRTGAETVASFVARLVRSFCVCVVVAFVSRREGMSRCRSCTGWKGGSAWWRVGLRMQGGFGRLGLEDWLCFEGAEAWFMILVIHGLREVLCETDSTSLSPALCQVSMFAFHRAVESFRHDRIRHCCRLATIRNSFVRSLCGA